MRPDEHDDADAAAGKRVEHERHRHGERLRREADGRRASHDREDDRSCEERESQEVERIADEPVSVAEQEVPAVERSHAAMLTQ